jgi:hypothetical protein
VKTASKVAIGTVILLAVSVFVVVTAGVTAMWLTNEVRVLALVILPAAIVASLLVVYFDWRTRLRRRVMAEAEERRTAA